MLPSDDRLDEFLTAGEERSRIHAARFGVASARRSPARDIPVITEQLKRDV